MQPEPRVANKSSCPVLFTHDLSALLHQVLLSARREAPPRRAVGEARPVFVFRMRERENARGKVGNLLLVFHFSTASSSELWECGNLAVLARFPRSCGKRGKPVF